MPLYNFGIELTLGVGQVAIGREVRIIFCYIDLLILFCGLNVVLAFSYVFYCTFWAICLSLCMVLMFLIVSMLLEV